jgi:hypothetical protein
LNKSILINEKYNCDFKGSGSKSISDFHGVAFNFDKKHLGKVLDSEIVKVWEQVEQDFNTGLIVAGTMGVELDGEKRHLHVSMILRNRALTAVTAGRYRSLIAKDRRAKPKIYIRNEKEVKTFTTVVASQPRGLKGGIRHSAYKWLAYPLKEMAKDFNDVNVFERDVNFTNCDDFKTIGMFDGGDDDASRKEKFANSVFMSWQKKCSKKNGEPETISTGSRLSTQAMEFMESVGIDDVEWTVEGNRAAMAMNQASIITKMVLNQIGKKRYNLATNFLGSDKEGKRVYALVMGLKPPPNRTSQDYENELYDALLKNRATTLGVRVESKVEKRLMLELAKMKKKCLRLENVCKGHVITIQKLRGKNTATNNERKRKLMLRLKVVQMKYNGELDAFQNSGCCSTLMGKLETEIDILKEKIKWINERDERDEEDEGDVVRGAESPQIPGAKRRRVEVPIPEKSADHRRQDALMAMSEEDFLFRR